MTPLPDFCRLQWVSAHAKAVWEPRLRAIGRAWNEIEIWSVIDAQRASALVYVPPEALPAFTLRLAAEGVSVLPVTRAGVPEGYSTTNAGLQGGDAWQYRVVITSGDPATLKYWAEHWAHDDRKIGAGLGFPSCCQQFFQRAWVERGSVDPTWAMADGQHELDGPPEANILLRWLGVRLVPHLPCRVDCPYSTLIGQRMATVGRRHGFAQEVGWITEMLEWPVEWSALHGIAIIKTPVVTAVARTDWTASTRVLRRRGTSYPAEGATGLSFPYRSATQVVKLTELRKFRQALTSEPLPPVPSVGTIVPNSGTPPTPPIDPSRLWLDNGFGSKASQDHAHATIAALTRDIPRSRVLDLGCGNGALLQRVGGRRLLGVEVDAARAAHARERLGSYGHVVTGDLTDPTCWPKGPYDLVFLMPGRLLETTPTKRAAVLEALALTPFVVLYAYGDWLTRYGTLDALARHAGFVLDRAMVTRRAEGVEGLVLERTAALMVLG